MAPTSTNRRKLHKAQSRVVLPPTGQTHALYRTSLQQCMGCYRFFDSQRKKIQHQLETRKQCCSLSKSSNYSNPARFCEPATNNPEGSPCTTSTMLFFPTNDNWFHKNPVEQQDRSYIPNGMFHPGNVDEHTIENSGNLEDDVHAHDNNTNFTDHFDFDMYHNIDYEEYVALTEGNDPINQSVEMQRQTEQEEVELVAKRNGGDKDDDLHESSCEHSFFSENEDIYNTTCNTSNEIETKQNGVDPDNVTVTLFQQDNVNFEFQLTKKEGKPQFFEHCINVTCYVELLALLDSFDHPPPLKTFDLILEWCQSAHYRGFEFGKLHPLRTTFVNTLKKISHEES